jgi:predicted chitinase
MPSRELDMPDHTSRVPDAGRRPAAPTPSSGPNPASTASRAANTDVRALNFTEGSAALRPQPAVVDGTRVAPPATGVTWEQVKGGAVLRSSDTGPAVSDLARRLASLGFQAGDPWRGLAEFRQAYSLGARAEVTAAIANALDKAVACSITAEQLVRIVPGLSPAQADAELRNLNVSMYVADLRTPERKAAFLAQIAHETGGLQRFEEMGDAAYFRQNYEGRRDLGNTRPGDGARFHGRGAIQLTGRANYRAATTALANGLGGTNLEKNPERADDPDVRYRTAAWFWTSHGLNDQADRGRFSAITQAINGGQRGRRDREAYHRRALTVLMPAPPRR